MVPSDHNLAALTSFVAAKRNGFTMLEWDRDLASFARALGIDAAVDPANRQSGTRGLFEGFIPAPLVAAARRDTERRGASYEGFYEATYASTTRPGVFVTEMAIIQRRDGLLYMRMAGTSIESKGWLFLIGNRLYGVLGNEPGDTFLFLILNGLPIRHVDMMDGLFVSNSCDVSLAPLATPIQFGFLEKLREDDAANDAHFATLAAKSRYVEPSELDEEMRRHLMPDVGPAASSAGIGDLLVQMPASRSLSRGSDFRGSDR
jgi:hypothetical protein